MILIRLSNEKVHFIDAARRPTLYRFFATETLLNGFFGQMS